MTTDSKNAVSSVLIVEDDPSIRQRLVRAVNSHPQLHVCHDLGLYQDGLECLVSHKPQVLLVDLGLPDGDGINLIHQAQELGKIESIVVTIFGDEPHVMRAIEAGAGGYLLKNTGIDDVGKSIVQMLAGGAPISPAIARYLLKRLYVENDQPTVSVSATTPQMTGRELEVLIHISKGLNYSEIGKILEISYHTVASHIKKIYKKLQVSSRSEAVYEAEQLGLIRIRE